jgi:hypothetical protein
MNEMEDLYHMLEGHGRGDEARELLDMVQTDCECKPDDIHVCKSCKLLLQTMYPEIPFEGEGL